MPGAVEAIASENELSICLRNKTISRRITRTEVTRKESVDSEVRVPTSIDVVANRECRLTGSTTPLETAYYDYLAVWLHGDVARMVEGSKAIIDDSAIPEGCGGTSLSN